MNKMPKITVVTPTYNRSAAIAKTIEKVLDQDFQDFEYLIIDDHSTDDTELHIKKFQDPRIRFLKTPKNSGGPALPMSVGAQNAAGEYIAFIDHDDLPKKEWLSSLYNEISKSNKTGIVWGQNAVLDGNGKRVSVAFRFPFKNNKITVEALRAWTPGTSGLMVRKLVFQEIGYFDENAWSIADLDFTYRFAVNTKYEVGYVPKIVIDYVAHASNLSRGASGKLVAATEYFVKKNTATLIDHPELKAFYLYKVAWLYNEMGHREKAKSILEEILILDPRKIKYQVYSLLLKLNLLKYVRPISEFRGWCSAKWRLLRSTWRTH